VGRSHGRRAEITSLSAASVSGVKGARAMPIGSSREQGLSRCQREEPTRRCQERMPNIRQLAGKAGRIETVE